MIRHKWIIGVRNKIASLSAECDSAAAIDGSRLSRAEREALQDKLRDAYQWIDRKLGF